MNRDQISLATRYIMGGKGKPVTLHVRRLPGRSVAEVTPDIPTGRFRYTYVTAGRFDADITLRELTNDLRAAERELNEQMAPGKWHMELVA